MWPKTKPIGLGTCTTSKPHLKPMLLPQTKKTRARAAHLF